MTEASKPLEEMSGPELVELFNTHAGRNGLQKVKKFASKEIGLRRVKTLNLTLPASPDLGLEAWGVQYGSNLERLVVILLKHIGLPVPISELMKGVYGTSSKDKKGPLMMVMNGVKATIIKKKLPYQVVKSRVEKENNFALCVKEE